MIQKNRKNNIKKSVWLPTLIFIYFLAMAIIFGPEMIKGGVSAKFIIICSCEIIVIVLLIAFLKRKENGKWGKNKG